MCAGGFGGGGPSPTNNAAVVEQRRQADEARVREEQRRAAVQSGMTSINKQFSRFDDGFFGRQRQAVLDMKLPQLDTQFADARKALTFALADAGTLDSTIANERQAKLEADYAREKAGIMSLADAEAQSAREAVENERTGLVNQLNANADPEAAAAQALSRGNTLATRAPKPSTLGQLFGDAAAGVGTYVTANRNAQLVGAINRLAPPAPTTNRSRVVGG